MTTTSEYLNEFTPDWPHGHVVVYKNGTTKPFIILTSNGPGDFPIWGHPIGDTFPWRLHADGTSGHAYYIRNAAPPKPKPREWWVMVDSCDGASIKIFDDKITALDNASGLRNVTVIRVREVIDEEDMK